MASLIAQLVRSPPALQRPQFDSWIGKICWRRDRPPTPVFLGFPCGSAGKESSCNVGDLDLISGLGRSPGEGKGYPLQYTGLENSMGSIVHGVAKSQTRLRAFHFHLGFSCSSVGKESVCSVRRPGFHPWVGKIPWRRKWQPTRVFLPGESHGQRSLAGYGPRGRKSRTSLSTILSVT